MISEKNFENKVPNDDIIEDLTFEDLLKQIDEYVEELKTKEVVLPIAKTTYVVKALSSQDEDYLKSSTFRKYSQILRKLFELILMKSSPKDRTTGLDFNTLSREISLLDIHELSKALLEITYETFRTSDNVSIICETCNKEYTTDDINNLELEYGKFVNINKTWDKEVPFTEYTIEFRPEKFAIRLKNSKSLVLIPTFELYIPTLHEYLRKQNVLDKYRASVKHQANDLLPGLQLSTNPSGQSLIDIFPVKRDTVIMLVKRIRVSLVNEQDNTILREEITDDDYKILQILDKLPISDLDQVRDKHIEVFGQYMPLYKTSFKCIECGSDIEIILRPELNLIDRILS